MKRHNNNPFNNQIVRFGALCAAATAFGAYVAASSDPYSNPGSSTPNEEQTPIPQKISTDSVDANSQFEPITSIAEFANTDLQAFTDDVNRQYSGDCDSRRNIGLGGAAVYARNETGEVINVGGFYDPGGDDIKVSKWDMDYTHVPHDARFYVFFNGKRHELKPKPAAFRRDKYSDELELTLPIPESVTIPEKPDCWK